VYVCLCWCRSQMRHFCLWELRSLISSTTIICFITTGALRRCHIQTPEVKISCLAKNAIKVVLIMLNWGMAVMWLFFSWSSPHIYFDRSQINYVLSVDRATVFFSQWRIWIWYQTCYLHWPWNIQMLWTVHEANTQK